MQSFTKTPRIFGPVTIDMRSIGVDDHGNRTITITNVDFDAFFGSTGPTEITVDRDSVVVHLDSIGDVVAKIKRVQEYTVSNSSIVTLKLVVQFSDYRLNSNLIDITPKPIPFVKYKDLLLCTIRLIESVDDGDDRYRNLLEKYEKIICDDTVYTIIKDAKKVMVKGYYDLSAINIPEAGHRSYATLLLYTSKNGPVSERDQDAIIEICKMFTMPAK